MLQLLESVPAQYHKDYIDIIWMNDYDIKYEVIMILHTMTLENKIFIIKILKFMSKEEVIRTLHLLVNTDKNFV